MAKTKKTIVAGALVVEAVYPRISPKDSERARGAKKKLSSDAQKAMNLKLSWMKLMLMLAANFRRGDTVAEVDFRKELEPKSKAEADAKLKAFRKRLRDYRRRKGQRLVMFWSPEHRHGDGHWHYHIVMNSCGEDINTLLRLWGYGRFETKPLRLDKEKGYESLARYMCKEQPDRVGARTWSYTRGAAKPDPPDLCRVDDDYSLQAPRGSRVLREAAESTEYGRYRVLMYLAPGWDGQAKARPIQKRKRR